ncbi:LamG domain-containing protein [Paenibacillus sp. LMG 31460]|uniref:LamG domain-containing protein n=1 Tax=Paenibacillus germinis TaxID=2654979 RepID=A0ABX1Z2Z0_9BACL|nr:LamG domain-containing protein [Paenibacillus germinis]NOU86631.1 LamG domain-containing protein [Paenibacillus germinis]
MTSKSALILQQDSLVSFWDFQEAEGQSRVAKGPFPYVLDEMSGPIKRVEEGVLGTYAAKLEYGQWFNLPRKDCPALDFHGPEAKLTIFAWLKRENRVNGQCEAIAGMWNETEKKRQYAMFLNLRIWGSGDQVGGHVSVEGGPTQGYPWCMTTAIGATPLAKDEWYALAFTYDGTYAKVYVDGVLDERETYNPYLYEKGLFDGGHTGADFTVGGVNRSGEMGNFYAGLLGGLAVFNEALTDEVIRKLSIK